MVLNWLNVRDKVCGEHKVDIFHVLVYNIKFISNTHFVAFIPWDLNLCSTVRTKGMPKYKSLHFIKYRTKKFLHFLTKNLKFENWCFKKIIKLHKAKGQALFKL